MVTLFHMKCRVCEHEYWYRGEQYEWEHCPVCPNQGEFNEFVLSDSQGDGPAK
jgi:hypothetical protein